MQLSHLGHCDTAPATNLLEGDMGLDGQFLDKTAPVYSAQLPARWATGCRIYRGIAD